MTTETEHPSDLNGTNFKNFASLTPEEIYDFLETRYGPGFAQWFVDRLDRRTQAA